MRVRRRIIHSSAEIVSNQYGPADIAGIAHQAGKGLYGIVDVVVVNPYRWIAGNLLATDPKQHYSKTFRPIGHGIQFAHLYFRI